MKRKTLQGKSLQIKQEGEEGRFSAVFATLNVIDHDGDVILPGAIESGQKVRISAYNHSSWGDALPVGKGVVTEQGEQLIVDGQFFLDTQSGAETYKVVKNLDDLTEYSFGFDITDAEFGQKDGKDVQFIKGLNIFEVSPVLLGAGIGTRTLDIKLKKEAVPTHDSKTVDKEWDGTAAESKLTNEGGYQVYKNMYAWYDANDDPGNKSTYKFPHHEVDENGIPGAANMNACTTGIAVLNGSMGGADIPDGDRLGVWEHLAKHLRDGGEEPPELKSKKSETFADHAARVQGDVAELVKRCQDIVELRREKGKNLGKDSIDRIQRIKAELQKSLDLIHEIVNDDNTVEQEYLKFIERRIKNG